jgi:hypothetical protein
MKASQTGRRSLDNRETIHAKAKHERLLRASIIGSGYVGSGGRGNIVLKE